MTRRRRPALAACTRHPFHPTTPWPSRFRCPRAFDATLLDSASAPLDPGDPDDRAYQAAVLALPPAQQVAFTMTEADQAPAAVAKRLAIPLQAATALIRLATDKVNTARLAAGTPARGGVPQWAPEVSRALQGSSSATGNSWT